MNTFGSQFRVTTFGESHGPMVGGVIDGCRPGFRLDIEEIQKELNRRRPGQSIPSTKRNELDKVEFVSGVFEGKTTGAPLTFFVHNQDVKSKDYEAIKSIYRPSHADYVYDQKYGIRDYRGGGRSSARETISRVVAGAIAKQILREEGVEIKAGLSRVGQIKLPDDYALVAKSQNNAFPCPDIHVSEQMIREIESARTRKDSVGGVVTCVILGLPVGLGEPIYDKLSARLASYMMGINAAKGFEIGEGFHSAEMMGCRCNDPFVVENGTVKVATNHGGGIQAGLSNGADVTMRVAFKPTPSIGQKQQTVDKYGNFVSLEIQGRHDPCVAVRAVPVVESMAACCILDFMLLK